MSERNYWCYRIDTNKRSYFESELYAGRLRQGWGWDAGQDLRDFKLDEGAGRNKAMFNGVKKGDILLIPRLPKWGDVAVVEATADWNAGYIFEIDKNLGDYGHIFPAKYLKSFTRNNEHVTGNLRSTLRNPSRFWSINHYSEDVDILLDTEVGELSKQQDYKSRLESSIGSVYDEVFDEQLFTEKLYNKMNEQFTSAEWEYALVHGLREMFPYYTVDRVGGPEEAKHGTDVLIRLPGIIPGYEYAIAIQVKDYYGYVHDDVISQINKAESYWESENLKLIEKIVIVTKAEKERNLELFKNGKDIKFIFANDLKQILSDIGKRFISMK